MAAAYAPIRDEAAKFFSASASKVPLSWPSLHAIVPHRIRRKFRSTRSKIRSRATPTSSITTLTTSFSPADTLRDLRAHHWTFYDGQYFLMASVAIFSLCVIQHPGPAIRAAVACLFMTSLILPITRQFFLPASPILCWLLFYFSCQYIGAEYRPGIWVKVLPALENIFYGANLSNILSAHKHPVLDVLAWLPYGITHFGAPFVVSLLLFIFGPPSTLPVFARTFGYMNLSGVIIQMLFPSSPPWYENLYGLAPANYGIPGSPAGLAAIDKLFGVDLYTSTFTASPLVFGAFPSLHSGCATTEVLFMCHVFPKLRPLWIVYVLWLCWSTMYLSHHYAVDLVGGALLASSYFFVAKAKFLPRLQPGKMFRWDYDFVEVGEKPATSGYEYGGLASIDDMDDDHPFGRSRGSDSDAWSLGSSSSYSNGYPSPNDRGLRSPMEDAVDSSWEGETLASQSDGERKG